MCINKYGKHKTKTKIIYNKFIFKIPCDVNIAILKFVQMILKMIRNKYS